MLSSSFFFKKIIIYKNQPASGSDIAIPRTFSPWHIFGINWFFKFSFPKCSIILIGPTFDSKTGKATAEEILALWIVEIFFFFEFLMRKLQFF